MTYGRSLEADLARRDFTVNAIAARLPSLELVDPFGGMRDLRAKVLRTPGRPEDSFNDDALRMLRAARFAAQLGFSVEPERAGGDDRDGRAAVGGVGGTDQRRADQAASARPAPTDRCAGYPCWWTRGSRTRYCPRCPSSGWSGTSISGTRTCTSTR